MNFDVTDEQEALATTVADLLGNELTDPRRMSVFEGDADHDAVLWDKLAACGAAGMLVPEALGGIGLGLLEAALVAEQLGAAAAPVPYWGHTLATIAVLLGGSDEQRRRWLPAMATGEVLGTVALAEGRGRWLPQDWALGAEPRLHGEKSFVPNGAAADVFVVGLAGGGLAVVEAGSGGVHVAPVPGSDRTRKLATVQLDGAAAEPLDPAATPAVVDAGLVLLAGDAFGGALACLRRAVAYTSTRVQFGVPVATFQAVKHQLADVAVEVEQARGLYWYAAHAADVDADDRRRAAMLAKSHLGDTYVRASRAAVELHGGIGFTWEFDLHLWVRRALHDRAVLCDPVRLRRLIADSADWGAARSAPT